MESWRRCAAALAVVMTCSTSAAAAAGRGMEFDLTLGYTHVELDGSESPFDSRDGFRLEPRFSWAPGGDPDGSHLRLGVGLAFTAYDRETDDGDVIIVDDDEIFVVDSDSIESLTLIEPMFTVSWRQLLGPADSGGERRWFVEPGIGAGLVIGQYWVGETFGWWLDTDVDEWDVTIAGRPFIRAGYQGDNWLLGVEASYTFGGSLEFTDQIEGDLQEWSLGLFFGGRW